MLKLETRAQRHLLVLALSASIGAGAHAQVGDPAPSQKATPGAAAGRAAAAILLGAGIGQAFGSPSRWHQNFDGLGRRVADQTGFVVIRSATARALTASTGWHPNPEPCVTARIRCALSRTLLLQAHNGARRPNLPLIGSLMAGSAASVLWRPERSRRSDALTYSLARVGGGIAAAVARRALREFRNGSKQ